MCAQRWPKARFISFFISACHTCISKEGLIKEVICRTLRIVRGLLHSTTTFFIAVSIILKCQIILKCHNCNIFKEVLLESSYGKGALPHLEHLIKVNNIT